MLTTSLIYKQPDIKMPSEVNSYLIESIKTYVKSNYDITNNLNTIIREALFLKGAYAEAIIPESSLDEIINPEYINDGEVSVEDYIDNVTKDYSSANAYVVDETDSLSIELFHDGGSIQVDDITKEDIKDLPVSISDNIGILRATEAMFKVIDKKTEDADVSNESLKVEIKLDLDNLFKRKEDNEENIPFVKVKEDGETSRRSIGAPLVMKIAVESVIPVHVTGDPSKHVGYFIMLDDKGAPITIRKENVSTVDEIDNLAKSKDNKLNIIKKAKDALYGITKKDPTIGEMEEIYGAILTEKITKSLRNGKYGDLVSINKNNDVYRVMLSRTLKNRKTRLLYVPEANFQYYAFEYRDNGTGKSLLEKVSVLFSIRAINLFARMMANIKNSVTTTEVSATLDDNDIEPTKTMEHIMSEALKTRQTQLPLGVTKIDDLVDWTQKVGFKFNFKGPGLPDMDINVSDESTSKVVPDTDLDEMIQEHIIMSFGLTVDMVQSGYDPEFATAILSNNILLAKRVIQLQDKLTPQITKHISKLLNNDGTIKAMLTRVIENNITAIKRYILKDIPKENKAGIKLLSNKENLVKYVLDQYLNNLEITLPKPAVQETENMKDAFEKYVSTLDDYLELIISEDALPEEFLGEMSGKLDTVKTIMKTILVKKWMADNGYMPEITKFLTLDEDGKPELDLLEDYNDYAEALSAALIPFLKRNKGVVEDTDAKLEKIDEEEEEVNEDSETDETSDNEPDTTEDDVGGDEDVSVGDDEDIGGGTDTGGDEDIPTGGTDEDLGDTEESNPEEDDFEEEEI